nr:unnamed protein product [Digitaria exilis]
MWICKTTGVPTSTKGFAFTHRVHKQPRSVALTRKDGTPVRREGHFGCLNFVYHFDLLAPVTAYKNRWSDDWWALWFYYSTEPDGSSLAGESLGKLAKPFEAYTDSCPEGLQFADMFRKISKNLEGLLKGDVADERANRILGKETSKESKESRKLLGNQWCNRVFEFFKKTARPRVASREGEAAEAKFGEGNTRGRGGHGGRWTGPKRQKTNWFEGPDEDEGVSATRPPSTTNVVGPPLAANPLQSCDPSVKDVVAVGWADPVDPADPFNVHYSDAEVEIEDTQKDIVVETTDLIAVESGSGSGSSPDSRDSSSKDSSADKGMEEGEKEETSSGSAIQPITRN